MPGKLVAIAVTRGAAPGWRGPSPRSARGSASERRAASRRERRQRRIAAEADDGGRLACGRISAQRLAARRRRASPAVLRQRDRIARRGSSRSGSRAIARAGKSPAVARRALVGREIDRRAARAQRLRQRFGRKQMAAGAAGGEQDERRAVAIRPSLRLGRQPLASARCIAARGRSRVSASSMPMP